MVKPRVIIADTDIGYIFPLQLKFVEEFFEKVELEIITDEDYFNELFNTHQKIDVMIVSENLYSSALQRHNIGNIFVMIEQDAEDQTAELNVNYIFKYTSIKEIFNKIVSKSVNIFDAAANNKKETQIILVYSACGGVGKTTIAMGLSACLTKNYKRVLYLNADRLHSFQRLLDNEAPVPSNEIYGKLSDESINNIYNEIKHVIRKEQFYYLPPFKAPMMSLGLNYSVYERIASTARKSGEYDFIIIDADVTFDADKAKLFSIADKVIIVTEQSMASVYATNALVSNISNIDGEKYIFVCNNFNKDEDNALISPKAMVKFSISDYVEHFSNYDKMTCDEISKDIGIRKISVLVI